MTDRVAVTGGSGVVGGAVIRHLAAAGFTPTCLSRSEASDRAIESLGGDPVRGDILDVESLTDAFDGASVVYHVAGINAMCLDDPAPMYRANVEGSRRVVEACRRARAGRLVYTSSAATIGEPAGTIGSERTVHRGWYLSDYERSKHLAEEVVFDECGDLPVVAVNPSSVQGPGRATGTGKLILDLLNGDLPALIDTRVSIVDIDDCARAHLAAAERGVPGRRYLVNSFTVSMRDAVRLLEQATGRTLSVRWIPAGAVGIAQKLLGLFSDRLPIPLCEEMLRTLRHGHAYDGSRAARELGLTLTGPNDLLERLVDWFQSEGLLRA